MKLKDRSRRIAGSFGARYGFKLRRKYGEVVLRYRGTRYKCPNCSKLVKLKRIAVGIWKCPKCNYSFTGGAYSPEL